MIFRSSSYLTKNRTALFTRIAAEWPTATTCPQSCTMAVLCWDNHCHRNCCADAMRPPPDSAAQQFPGRCCRAHCWLCWRHPSSFLHLRQSLGTFGAGPTIFGDDFSVVRELWYKGFLRGIRWQLRISWVHWIQARYPLVDGRALVLPAASGTLRVYINNLSATSHARREVCTPPYRWSIHCTEFLLKFQN